MAANIELIKKVRELTGAGFMDVKKALEESNDDIDAAVQWLREKGIAKAAKKASAIATEGVVKVIVRGDSAIIYEVNCETDFVAKNDNFLELVDDIGLTLLCGGEPDYVKATTILKTSKDVSIEYACKELTGKIGEKIQLRRYQIIRKQPEQMFAHYEHSNNRIGVLLTLDKPIEIDVAKDIAMHAAAMAPAYMSADKVDQKWLENETKILKEQTLAEGKIPPERVDMAIKGRVNKLLSEVVLESQQFVKDPSISVKDHLNKNGQATLLRYIRFQLGEGIEKKVIDFAAEVAAQMKK